MRKLIALIYGIRDYFWRVIARLQFALRGVAWPNNFTVRGVMGLSAGGTIVIGDGVTILNHSRYNRAGINHPTQIVAAPGAVLTIGNNVGISGAAIFAEQEITIGNDVLIGANCRIYDTDFHPLDAIARRQKQPAATATVKIGNDVWLGANVTVLKGVTIGDRAVVAAGSIVSSDIASDTLVGGVPARPIKSLEKVI